MFSNTLHTDGASECAIDVSSVTYFNIFNCSFEYWHIGVILDQGEIVTIRDCVFNLLNGQSGDRGIWLVNGPDYTEGASYGYTNVIRVEDNTFVSSASTQISIVDDGGYTHTYANNNFTYDGRAIRLVQSNGCLISGNYFEGANGIPILFHDHTFDNDVARGGHVTVNLLGNFFSPQAYASVDFSVATYCANSIGNEYLGTPETANILGGDSVGTFVSIGDYYFDNYALLDSTPVATSIITSYSDPYRGLAISGKLKFELPTSDPSVVGQWWADSDVVTISS
jgi:hypothetical protein